MEIQDLRKDELRNIIKDTFHGQMDDYSNEEIAEMTATMVDKYPSTNMIRRIIELAMELSSDKELHSLEKMVDRIKTEIWGWIGVQLLTEVKNKGFWKIFLENIWWFQKLSLSLHREIKSDNSLFVGSARR